MTYTKISYDKTINLLYLRTYDILSKYDIYYIGYPFIKIALLNNKIQLTDDMIIIDGITSDNFITSNNKKYLSFISHNKYYVFVIFLINDKVLIKIYNLRCNLHGYDNIYDCPICCKSRHTQDEYNQAIINLFLNKLS